MLGHMLVLTPNNKFMGSRPAPSDLILSELNKSSSRPSRFKANGAITLFCSSHFCPCDAWLTSANVTIEHQSEVIYMETPDAPPGLTLSGPERPNSRSLILELLYFRKDLGPSDLTLSDLERSSSRH